MSYIIEFEIAALCIELMLIIVYGMRRFYPSIVNKVYVGMTICTLIATAFNIISVFTLMAVDKIPIWVNYITNIIYLAAYNGCAVFFFVYVLHLTGQMKKTVVYRIIYLVCIAIDAFLLITTPFTKWIIHFDNGVYEHGPLFLVLYATSISLLLAVMFLFLRYRKMLNKFQSFSILVFNIGTLAAIVIQFFKSSMLIQDFIIALFLVMVYVSLQNPDDYMDKRTECFNQTAFYEIVGRYIEKKTSFSVVAFTLDDFQYINHLLGVKAGNDVLDNISLFLIDKFGYKRTFHLMGCRYAFLLAGKLRNGHIPLFQHGWGPSRMIYIIKRYTIV